MLQRSIVTALQHNGTTCSLHVAHLQAFSATGLKHIMEFAEAMKTAADTLPDDLKPYGQAMTKHILEVLTEAYVESLKLCSDLQEIDREARTLEH